MAEEVLLKRVVPQGQQKQALKNMLMLLSMAGATKASALSKLEAQGYSARDVADALDELKLEGKIEEQTVTKGVNR